ncbi:MAG TPA: DUF2188 domain-containing protein [Mycobacteriales bacterium]|nr:DUF2188 domain-containing protein [Mycobacteriales bacterium]
MALKRIDVVKKGGTWTATSSGQVISRSETKQELVRETIAAVKQGGQPTSVRIHRADGTIQEERTYPRSADPRSSRG